MVGGARGTLICMGSGGRVKEGHTDLEMGAPSCGLGVDVGVVVG